MATASAAVTASLGRPDGDAMPAGEMLAAVERIASAVPVPVSADLEGGYGLEPDELEARLLETGAVGLNLEDTDHHGPRDLLPAEGQTRRIEGAKAAARRAGVDIVLNARIDAEPAAAPRAEPRVAELLRRAERCAQAGADCLYPIRLAAEDDIAAFAAAAPAPVNVLVRPGSPSPARLRALGVARVTFGPGLQRVALAALERFAARLDPGGDEPVYPPA